MKQRTTKPTTGAALPRKLWPKYLAQYRKATDAVGGFQVSPRALGAALYVHTGTVLHSVRGKRRKYLRRAWKVAHHLPHWPDGASKGVALGMLVLLLVAAIQAKPGGGK